MKQPRQIHATELLYIYLYVSTYLYVVGIVVIFFPICTASSIRFLHTEHVVVVTYFTFNCDCSDYVVILIAQRAAHESTKNKSGG